MAGNTGMSFSKLSPDTLIQRFERQAADYPNASAIVSHDAQLSYDALDRLSAGLARRLMQLGISTGAIVPLCFEKSAWAIVAMLAVTRAGAAFVPLHPPYPADRKKIMVDACHANTLLCSALQYESLRDMTENVISVGQEDVSSLEVLRSPDLPVVTADDVAYVLFTSGSTGEPKGVVVEHGNLCTTCDTFGPQFRVSRASRVLQWSSFVFDVSMFDIFCTLMVGACICIPSEAERHEDTEGAAERLKATWAFFTPSVADFLDPRRMPTLQTVVLGGEPLNSALISRWCRTVCLLQCYGPAETTIFFTSTQPLTDQSQPNVIGRHLVGGAYVVDPDNHNTLIDITGKVGELVIQGPTVGRGYLGDPLRTRNAFIDPPAWAPRNEGNSRFYKTGDLVARNNDGSLIIAGRKDKMVKIRGQRVDLDEIRCRIVDSSRRIRQVLPYFRASPERDKRHSLVAFYVSDDSAKDYESASTPITMSEDDHKDVRQVVDVLSKTLPSYMVPTLFIPLPALPLNAAGKPDQAALDRALGMLTNEALEVLTLRSKTHHWLGPSTDMEASLQKLWALFLDAEVSDVSCADHFVTIGGDSVKAMRIVAKAREQDIIVSFLDIMTAPNLQELAKMASKASSAPVALPKTIPPFSLLSHCPPDDIVRDSALQCKVAMEDIEDCFPCTPLQEGIFSSSIRHPRTYVSQNVFKLKPAVDMARLMHAWEAVSSATSILRSRIVSLGSTGLSQVVVRGDITWHRAQDLQYYLSQDIESPVMAGTPLNRFAIATNGEDGFYLIWTTHHAIYDLFTLRMCMRQVLAVYQDNPGRGVLVNFNSFVGHLQSTESAASEKYWTSYLEGATLPAWPSTTETGLTGLDITISRHHQSLPPLTGKYTLPTYIKAALAVVLGIYSNTEDVLFAVTSSGRDTILPGILDVAGPTLATYPMRLSAEPEHSISSLLESAEASTLAIIPHQHFGLQNIARLNGGSAVASAMRTLLVIQPNLESGPETGDGLLCLDEGHSHEELVGSYPLTLECRIGPEGVQLKAEYCARLIDGIESFLATIGSLIQQLQERPKSSPIKCLTLQRTEILGNLTCGAFDSSMIPVDARIHDLIGHSCRERPHKTAVVGHDGAFTYAQLDAAATNLAAKLQELGVEKETLVPVCAEKSVWNVVGLIAVLRAGGAFVPLDPAAPHGRHVEILEQLRPSIILVSPGQDQSWKALVPNVLELGSALQAHLDTQLPPLEIQEHATPQSLAYCMFTSGTTGIPKGVEIEHQTFVTGALARAALINRTETSRVFQFSSLSFDTAIEDIFTTLIVGGTVAIPSEAERKSDIVGAMKRLQVNCADLTPSVANLFHPSGVPSLKTLILGGEAANQPLLRKWSSIEVINTYGPTECAIVTTVKKISNTDEDHLNIGAAPCGRVSVVHPQNIDILLPPGAVGELLIEGPILARGYFQNRMATDAAFITNLAWAGPGRRFYRTGDLVRLQADGSISFSGRKGGMVKLRGNRLELSEIEAKCLSMGIFQDVLVDIVDISQRDTLAAFVVSKEIQTKTFTLMELSKSLKTSIAQVREQLSAALPSYMVPSIYFPISMAPLTTSGKRDVRKLRAAVAQLSEKQLQSFRCVMEKDDVVAANPDTVEETVLQSMWSQVLSVSPSEISKATNFFSLGADSITAMKLAAHAHEQGFELSVANIFQAATFKDMAQLLRRTQAGPSVSLADPAPFTLLGDWKKHAKILLQVESFFPEDLVEDVYPCTPWQEGIMALSSRQTGAYTARHMFEVPESVDLDRLRAACNSVTSINSILKTHIVYIEGHGSYQVVLKTEEGCQIFPDGAQADAHLASMTMDYGDPLSRFVIQRSSRGHGARLTWKAHHSVFDGPSVGLVVQQLLKAYAAEPPSPPPYSRFLRSLQQKSQDSSKQFWRDALHGFVFNNLFSSPGAESHARKEERLDTTCTLDNEAIRSTKGAGITLATIVSAAWSVVVSDFSAGSSDLVFGATLSGRLVDVDDIEELVGPCIATVPVRVRLQRDARVHSWLQDLQTQSARIIPHQHIGLQHLQDINMDACRFESILIIQADSDKTSHVNSDLLKDVGSKIENGQEGYYTHPLVLEVGLKSPSIHISATFDAAIVPGETVGIMLDSFEHILQQLCGCSSSTRIKDMNTCGPKSQEKIGSWNHATPSASDDTIIGSIRRCMYPKAMAIEAWDGHLTYAQLDTYSSTLARYICEQDTAIPSAYVVPICMERSVWVPVAMLGVQKARKAYAALDSTHPRRRLAEMCHQVGASLVVTDSKNSQIFDGQGPAKVLILDGTFFKPEISDSDIEQFQLSLPTVLPSDPAIVVFTSGSTGVPKAIVLQHFAITSAAREFCPRMDFSRTSRVLQNAAFAFDIHACEIFLTLISGGCLVISAEDRSLLVETVQQHNINWLFSTPSAVPLLGTPERIPTVKTLMMIGEAPTKEIFKTWTTPNLHLINAYGPAENTLFTSMTSVSGPSTDTQDIGKGINTLTWIVDANDPERLLPLGAVGELLLDGCQLAMEYHGQPGVTALSFINPPGWSKSFGVFSSGRRLYRTGDLVQYQSDGSLRILGRIDTMAKVNGQRLELGEVEKSLNTHSENFNCISEVIHAKGQDVLIAIVELSPSASKSNLGNEGNTCLLQLPLSIKKIMTETRKAMAEDLPGYMVPSLFFAVENLPLTASAKMNRKLLRELAEQATRDDWGKYSLEDEALKQEPETNTQRLLQRVWSSVLKVPLDRIGAGDNFFSLGGDSIKAIRLSALVGSELKPFRPKVSDVFRYPRLRDFAKYIDMGTHPQAVVKPQDAFAMFNGLRDIGKFVQEVAQSLRVDAADIADMYPCTALQEGMLTVSAQSPGAYVAEHIWHLPVQLDAERLERAWRKVVDAFDILRTHIVPQAHLGMLQIVLKRGTYPSLLIEERARTPYHNDLSRFTLEQRGSNPRLIWKSHHALYDGWMLEALAKELHKAYFDEPQGSFMQFGTFIRYLSLQDQADSRHYWSKYLDGATVTQFPDVKHDFSDQNQHQKLRSMTTAIESAHGVTIACILRAAWAMVVASYSGSRDVIFGETLSGRNTDMDGIETIFGPTVTTVPMRITLDNDQPVAEFLTDIHQNSATMMQYEQLGLQNIQKLSEDAASACQFQNLLIVQSGAGADQTDQLLVPARDEDIQTAYHTLPLVLQCTIEEDRIDLEATFSTARISAVQMQRILHQTIETLQTISTAPGTTTLAEISILSSQDKMELRQWNSAVPEIVDDCIHNIIRRQAEERPDAQAVCSHDGVLTYSELENLSSNVGHHLRANGVGKGDIVPLCFEKSLWPMVAMLGVLKSGAAFAPMDPSHPSDRLKDIVGQLAPKVILLSPTTSSIDFGCTARRLILTSGSVVLDSSTAFQQTTVAPSDLAYVIFTSGSTGSPKGVMISHGPFCSGVKPRDVALARSTESRVLQFASFSFDTSLEDTLTTWMFGGCTCIPSEHERLNDLEGAIQRMSVNCAHITPSLANALSPDSVPTLRQLRLGGERMTAGHLRTWTADPNFDLRNVYGPTECCITTSGTGTLGPDADSANIGYPVACTVWIVNPEDHNRLAPIGCIGEILVEGPIVADGYLNNPSKTQESFVTDPAWVKDFGGVRGRRFYKTGDVARYADDGSLVFIGRKDSQVKLNGNRVETGDVETHLRKALPPVHDSAVEIITPSGPNQKSMLVAFVTLQDDFEGDEKQLSVLPQATKDRLAVVLHGVNETMRAALPSFMVPSAYIPLKAMPRSTAGKTDRKVLKQLVHGLDALQLRSFVNTKTVKRHVTTRVEKDLQALWAAVLKLEKSTVMATDSFISLGGDSVLALRLVSNARSQNMFFTVADVLKSASLGELAVKMVSGNHAATDLASSGQGQAFTPTSSQDASEGEPWEGIKRALHIQYNQIESIDKATAFQDEAFGASLLKERGYINDFIFEFGGPVQHHRLQHACERLVSRHGSLRTVFSFHNGVLYQVVLRYRLLNRPRLTVVDGFGALQPVQLPGGLGENLVSFTLYQSERPKLVVSISHALYDGTSHAILCRELAAAYSGDELDDAPQFMTFTKALGPPTQESESFWRSLLQGSAMTNIVAASGPSHSNVVAHNVSQTAHFSLARLKTHGFTVASLLKSGWALVLARFSASHDVVFGHVVSTRGLAPDMDENFIGPSIEVVPVRVVLEEDTSCFNVLQGVQDQYISGMKHHAFGFQNMVEHCTEWPSWTRFSSVVQHQNLEETVSEMRFGDDLQVDARVEATPFDSSDLWILSTPLTPETFEIKMSFCEAVLPLQTVNMLLHQLISEMHSLLVGLTLEQSSGQGMPVVPAVSKMRFLPRPNTAKSRCVADQVVTVDQHTEDLVSTAWIALADACSVAASRQDDVTPFWEVCPGNPFILAAVLCRSYETEGLTLPIEAVLAAPTKSSQRALIHGMR